MAGLRHPRGMKLVLRGWRVGVWWLRIRGPRADADVFLVLVEPVVKSGVGALAGTPDCALSTSYSVVCNAKLPRAAIEIVDLD